MAQAVATVLKTYVQEGLVLNKDLVARFRADVGGPSETGLSDEQVRYVAKRMRPEAAALPVSVADAQAAIRELLAAGTGKGILNKTANLGGISSEVAAILSPHTLRNPDATIHTLDTFSAHHILTSHGDATTEAARGQLPITASDLERIPEILQSPDKVYYQGENGRGQQLIGYEKTIGDVFYYVEEYRAKGNSLHTETLYKRRQKGKGGESMSSDAPISPNVQNDPPAATNVRNERGTVTPTPVNPASHQ